MSYSPWRYSGDFAQIQRLAGTMKAEAHGIDVKPLSELGLTDEQLEEVLKIERHAFLMGGASGLYAIAPLIPEPTESNIVALVESGADYE